MYIDKKIKPQYSMDAKKYKGRVVVVECKFSLRCMIQVYQLSSLACYIYFPPNPAVLSWLCGGVVHVSLSHSAIQPYYNVHVFPTAIQRVEKCFSKKYGKKEAKLCHKLYKYDLCVKPTLAEEMPSDCAKRVTWDEPKGN